MKHEFLKTALFVAAAVALAITAAWVDPGSARPEILSDEGEPLFPGFREVDQVKAIEVVDYNEEQAVARPLKVEFRNNRWLLPSHNDYPAEAGDRLAKAAGAFLGLKKDTVVSDLIEDHAQYGVIDPLDASTGSLSGRGTRVTLRDEQGGVLADVILGRAVPEKEGFRYLRLPGQKRTYGVKTEADPSADFADWVEDNLLRLAASEIRQITVNSYSIDETFGRLANARRVVITKDGGSWKSEGDYTPNQAAIRATVNTLASIRIAGARPKPEPLARQLRDGQLEMTLETMMSLRQRGYFLTQTGQLLSNEGEVMVETSRGLLYTLRFGEIVSGGAVSAEEQEDSGTGQQDRYLFVTVSHSAERAAKYGGDAASGQRDAAYLSRKFADWYYVISGADFAQLRLRQ